MKRMGLCFLLLCLLTACGAPEKISGTVAEVRVEEGVGVVSFVVQTEGGPIGILISNQTQIFSFVDGMTSEQFRAGSFGDVTVTVEHENLRRNGITQDNQQLTTYYAVRIEVTGYSTGETATLADGTRLNIWKQFSDDIYRQTDGVELLRIRRMFDLDHVEVGGVESLQDLGEEAQLNILDFYEHQGLLYDVQAELEKMHRFYLEQEDPSQFRSGLIDQQVAPTASNESVMYFLTTVMLPADGAGTYTEQRIGAAFDRSTGEFIPNWALFSCTPEEAKRTILDHMGVHDPALRRELEQTLPPENITFFPDHMELSFFSGTPPSQESISGASLTYDQDLSGLLHQWAIPKQ